MPKVKELETRNVHKQQWTSLKHNLCMARVFSGPSRIRDGELETIQRIPEGFEVLLLPERAEEFAPGMNGEILGQAAKKMT